MQPLLRAHRLLKGTWPPALLPTASAEGLGVAWATHTSSASLPWSLLLLFGRPGPGLQLGGGSFGGELGEVRPRLGWLVSPVTRGPGEFPLLSSPGFFTRPPLSRKITPLFPACAPQLRDSPHPNPADRNSGLGLGSGRLDARLTMAEATLPALHNGSDSEREAEELGWGWGKRGSNPWLLPLWQPPHPSSFLPCRQLG